MEYSKIIMCPPRVTRTAILEENLKNKKKEISVVYYNTM